MNEIVGKIVIMGKKTGLLLLEYAYIVLQWMIRFFKVQMQKFRKCGAQKNVDKAYTGLGAEIYTFYKQGGDAGWHNVPSIEQQIRRVEDAEAAMFRIDETIDDIDNAYLARKEQLKSTYAARRAALDAKPPAEGQY